MQCELWTTLIAGHQIWLISLSKHAFPCVSIYCNYFGFCRFCHSRHSGAFPCILLAPVFSITSYWTNFEIIPKLPTYNRSISSLPKPGNEHLNISDSFKAQTHYLILTQTTIIILFTQTTSNEFHNSGRTANSFLISFSMRVISTYWVSNADNGIGDLSATTDTSTDIICSQCFHATSLIGYYNCNSTSIQLWFN